MTGFGKLVWQFAGELKEHAKNGFKVVPPAVYASRLKKCEGCPLKAKDSWKCTDCGCNMEIKAKWQTSRCPQKPPLWDREIEAEDENG